jgi:hypothetical protein
MFTTLKAGQIQRGDLRDQHTRRRAHALAPGDAPDDSVRLPLIQAHASLVPARFSNAPRAPSALQANRAIQTRGREATAR